MMTKELNQRRAELCTSLPALTLRRDHGFQLKCNAEKLDLFGVTHHTATEMARMTQHQAAADAAIRAIQLSCAASTTKSGAHQAVASQRRLAASCGEDEPT
jgi:hypothetical protein